MGNRKSVHRSGTSGLGDAMLTVLVFQLGLATMITATGGPSQIRISLDPQPALIGEDVEIRCTHNIRSVINYHPWIAVDGETTTLNTLTNQEKYSLNKSTIINGEAVYVVIMHNVRESDNGTTFECYFTLNGGEEIRSGTVALRVRHEDVRSITPSLSSSVTILAPDQTDTGSHFEMVTASSNLTVYNVVKENSTATVHSSTVIVASVCAIIGGIIVLIIIVSSVCLYVKVRRKRVLWYAYDSTCRAGEHGEPTKTANSHCYWVLPWKTANRKAKDLPNVSNKDTVYDEPFDYHYDFGQRGTCSRNAPRDYEVSIECMKRQVAMDPNQNYEKLDPATMINKGAHPKDNYKIIKPAKKCQLEPAENIISQSFPITTATGTSKPTAGVERHLSANGYETMESIKVRQKEVKKPSTCEDCNEYVEIQASGKCSARIRSLPTPWHAQQQECTGTTQSPHIYDEVVLQ